MPLIIVGFGILLLLALILLKMKPLYALLIVSGVVGLAEGLSAVTTLQSIGSGIFDTLKNIALVLCLGAMFGKIIETSKAATTITTSLIGWFGERNIHWAIMITGLIVGIPLFYNAGFVILIPLVFATASVARVPLLWVGIPMAASLSVTHGFLPPHPGPTAIASIFHADIGLTLLYGLIITIPTVVLAGPLFANTLRNLPTMTAAPVSNVQSDNLPKPAISFAIALFPVLLIATATLVQPMLNSGLLKSILNFAGTPSIALALSLVLAIYVFCLRNQVKVPQISRSLYSSIKDIFLIILVIAAGGGFKQVLIDSGVGSYIKTLASGFSFSPLLLAWSVAALLRVSLGSATVAGLTAAGIVLPFVPSSHPELMVLAVGAGSLMFSHVNDTGFWMFKEYFNLSLKQTFLSWTMMETIVSFSGLLGVLILDTLI
jgi:Gnt-I system high-affinity gluconate transporter